jgi:hypothetical protein
MRGSSSYQVRWANPLALSQPRWRAIEITSAIRACWSETSSCIGDRVSVGRRRYLWTVNRFLPKTFFLSIVAVITGSRALQSGCACRAGAKSPGGAHPHKSVTRTAPPYVSVHFGPRNGRSLSLSISIDQNGQTLIRKQSSRTEQVAPNG